MVCPKCGRDCGSDAFCGGCGTKLEAEKPRKTGRLCPHCGGTEAVGNTCAYCGMELPLEYGQAAAKKKEKYEVPMRDFHGSGDTLRLSEDAIALRVNHNPDEVYVTRIPYNEITAVHYLRPGSGIPTSVGYLVFRCEANKDVPMPKSGEYAKDETAIRTVHTNDVLYFHIFCYLQTLAPPTARFTMGIPRENKMDVGELGKGFDFDAYFEKFSPYRSLAAAVLRYHSDIPEGRTRDVIDAEFDKRQLLLYAAQPELAARDLALVIKKYCKD